MSTTARSQHSGVSQAARPIKTRGQKPKKITAQRNCKGYLSFIISVPGGYSCSKFFASLKVILDITWRFESIKIGVVFVEFCWTITKDLVSRRDHSAQKHIPEIRECSLIEVLLRTCYKNNI